MSQCWYGWAGGSYPPTPGTTPGTTPPPPDNRFQFGKTWKKPNAHVKGKSVNWERERERERKSEWERERERELGLLRLRGTKLKHQIQPNCTYQRLTTLHPQKHCADKRSYPSFRVAFLLFFPLSMKFTFSPSEKIGLPSQNLYFSIQKLG